MLMPDAVIVPLVGLTNTGFRLLGYGGGYFDRRASAAAPRPYAIGLGYADAALQTIYPRRTTFPWI